MPFDYREKLALITGASSGLGFHLAEVFHRGGCRVALVARRRDRLEELARSLDPMQKTARPFPFDLKQMDRIPSLVEEVTTSFGQSIQVLIHCAGASVYGEIERTPLDAVQHLFGLNLLAGIRLVQCVLLPMKERREGQVIWIGSGSSFRGIPRAAAYSASKASVQCFCDALRNEVREFGVDVLLVIPGALRTDFHPNQPNYSSDGKLRSTGSASDPRWIARRVFQAGKRRGSQIILGPYAWIGKHLSYWAPWLLDRAYRSQLK